jgi:hypothetical protein
MLTSWWGLNFRQRIRRTVFARQEIIGSWMVGDPLGLGIPLDLFAGTKGNITQMADAGEPMAIFEITIALLARFDPVEPLPLMAGRTG